MFLVSSNLVVWPGFIVVWISVQIPNSMPMVNRSYLWDMPDSVSLYYAVFPSQVFAQEVHVTDSLIPRNVVEALSPSFVAEWGPAID